MGLKINYGCGDEPLPNFINIDANPNAIVKPDVVCDILQAPLPFKDNEVEVVTFLHCIEHIMKQNWSKVFTEFYRILEPEGQLMLAYPEFEVCAKYFIENHKGARDYWRMTLFGRQHYSGDFHVVPMRTPEVIILLKQHGFHGIKYGPEPDEWNTFLTCKKGVPQTNREDLYKKEIFGVMA